MAYLYFRSHGYRKMRIRRAPWQQVLIDDDYLSVARLPRVVHCMFKSVILKISEIALPWK